MSVYIGELDGTHASESADSMAPRRLDGSKVYGSVVERGYSLSRMYLSGYRIFGFWGLSEKLIDLN